MLHAVIGANYGDEGKGRCVDWLASRLDRGVVVRYNSSAQAGHTVQIGEQRHVFSHFGSGTLRDWPTLLTHKFVVHPVIFNREFERLVALGHRPEIFVDRTCITVTPHDAFINQICESVRGNDRHGSCGIGFGEAIGRHEYESLLSIYAGEISPSLDHLRSYVLAVIEERKIDVKLASAELQHVHASISNNTFVMDNWLKHWELFHGRITLLRRETCELLLATTPNVIFEGAQGLQLHAENGDFPHVTRCRTGIEDVAELLDRASITEAVQPWYCTRSYVTRHGAGPLPGEQPTLPGYDVIDPTNQPNAWQGSLRFAPLHLHHEVTERSVVDSAWARVQYPSVNINQPNIMMSCCDQAPASVVATLTRHIAIDAQELWLGYGPDSADTERYEHRGAPMGGTVDEAIVAEEPTSEVGAVEAEKVEEEETEA